MAQPQGSLLIPEVLGNLSPNWKWHLKWEDNKENSRPPLFVQQTLAGKAWQANHQISNQLYIWGLIWPLTSRVWERAEVRMTTALWGEAEAPSPNVSNPLQAPSRQISHKPISHISATRGPMRKPITDIFFETYLPLQDYDHMYDVNVGH